MTTDEIRSLVEQTIAGQGSAVDVGGGLPKILNAICDALDAIPAPPEPVVVPDWVKGIPVIAPNEIDVPIEINRFRSIRDSGAVVYEGCLYVKCTNNSFVHEFIEEYSATEATVYVRSYVIEATSELSMYTALLARSDTSSIRYVEM